MFPFPYSKNDDDEVCVTLTEQKTGRTLDCTVEYSMEIEGENYVLLLPLDTPIEIFTWQGENDEDEEALPVDEEEEIDLIFDIAKVVLEEQNLKLQRTAITLTVAGDLPDFPEEDEESDDNNHNGEGEYEELMKLASFYHEEQEYAIYTPLDPFYILARMRPDGTPELLSEEEFQRLEPLLPMLEEELLIDELDSE